MLFKIINTKKLLMKLLDEPNKQNNFRKVNDSANMGRGKIISKNR